MDLSSQWWVRWEVEMPTPELVARVSALGRHTLIHHPPHSLLEHTKKPL